MSRCGTRFKDGATCGDKTAHVRAQMRRGVTPGHRCHWPNCDKPTPAATYMCYAHWRRLPKRLQSKIRAAYKIGQEVSKTPTREYITVVREVELWISCEESGL
jgi:hypothetical protein